MRKSKDNVFHLSLPNQLVQCANIKTQWQTNNRNKGVDVEGRKVKRHDME